jgi:hypothetical protein
MNTLLESNISEVSADLEAGSKLFQDIDAAGERLAALRSKIEGRRNMATRNPILRPSSVDAMAQRAIERGVGLDRKQVARPGRRA